MASQDEGFLEDFRDALEGLQLNSRFEIQNLTMIARESTEEALVISQALQDHIKRAAPHKKLPALYVLDSIVKNVGTPYTIFFGKRLYNTFMEAYASVDMATRRKMDEMLKTWKEPIPGSIDTRPVFAPDVTRPIENALMQARASGNQQLRRMMGPGRQMPQGVPYRDSPTPPAARPPSQSNGGYIGGPPPIPGVNNAPYGQHGQPPPAQYPYHQPPSSQSTPQPPANIPAFQPPYHGSYGMAAQPTISTDALKEDIQGLITAFRAEFARNPQDPSIQSKLKALLDLQGILQAQNLPQDQLVLIKNQIAGLAVTIRAPPAQTPTPVPISQPVAVAPPPAAAPKVSIDSILGSGALAALLARGSGTPQASTPQPPPATVAIRSPPPQRAEPQQSAAPADPMALLGMLRKAGMLTAATPSSGSTPVPSLTPTVPLPFPPPGIPTGPPSMDNFTGDIAFNALSLKQFRPHLVPLMFEALGPQCTHCGRRFKTDDEGKKKKMAHMDWHFKVNQRIAEAEKSGQHRSWFVDETDWINTRETIDEDRIAAPGDASGTQGSSSKTPNLHYIPVPSDPVLKNSVCPICQENFKQIYLDDAGDWVWEDAINVDGRIYHASCHQEVTGNVAGVGTSNPYTRGTPEPVLGKRKAEDELAGLRGKMKLETA
ncbi:hypothetical protein JX265_005049 [Neoarthrinium moseri]|uniref:CID domain-containing protein n=1 Tax=Neoarthrinium moseri TaxID=1658444 RepID=A0A9Q0AMZ4_9PEZI|nr:uncharacterized protein JN550_009227 [Neoarthrinium moseri]KAI1863948.1 hypothetical protein JN550_009227 [Neoarthrinium moseri]KAI1873427.1 hypothetical protein JX265_005049 [Neoarthrinium moseri]